MASGTGNNLAGAAGTGRGRRRSVRVNPKFYVFLLVIAAVVVAVCWVVLGRDTAAVQQGTMEYELTTQVLLVRDEVVVAAENFEAVSYLVPDQQRVEADTAVADVYRRGYNEKVTNDLVDLQTKILQYQMSLQETYPAELTELDNQIADKTAQIREIAAGGDGDAVLAERELQQLMTERAQYLREHTAGDQQLEGYYAQEQQLQERVNSWKDTWRSPSAGVVSYYYDGYEPFISAENIRTASVGMVESILNGTLAVAETAENAAPLYRLVNNFQWYIVVPAEHPIRELANDTHFQVVFEDYPDRAYEGTVIGHIAEGEDQLYVLEFNEDIGSLVNTRRARATLRTSFTGFEIPDGALEEQGGQTGVVVVGTDKSRTFVPVAVLIQQDGRSIVEPQNDPSVLAAGSEIEV